MTDTAAGLSTGGQASAEHSMHHRCTETAGENAEEIRPMFPWSIAIPIRWHFIETMDRAETVRPEMTGIGELENYLERVVSAEHPPGLSVAVVKDGRMVYANGFGVADGPRNVLATRDTVYHWWSMTKIPTAVAVMQLH